MALDPVRDAARLRGLAGGRRLARARGCVVPLLIPLLSVCECDCPHMWFLRPVVCAIYGRDALPLVGCFLILACVWRNGRRMMRALALGAPQRVLGA